VAEQWGKKLQTNWKEVAEQWGKKWQTNWKEVAEQLGKKWQINRKEGAEQLGEKRQTNRQSALGCKNLLVGKRHVNSGAYARASSGKTVVAGCRIVHS
jgi:hypothetical protein